MSYKPLGKILPFHELAGIFPLMAGAAFEELADDIAARGLLEPIIVLDGKILDGRNRAEACQARGVDPIFIEYEGDDPLRFVVSKNLHRRHLTDQQRSMLAGQLANQKTVGKRKPGAITNGDAAKLMNVSYASTIRAARVANSGNKELAAAVMNGKMPLSKAVEAIGGAPKLISSPPLSAHFAEIREWVKALPTSQTKRAHIGERISAVRDFAAAMGVAYVLKGNGTNED